MNDRPQSILDEISSIDHLLKAWNLLNKSRPNSSGLSNVSIKEFKGRLSQELEGISSDLRSGSFKFSKVKGATAKKKNNDLRPLRISEIKDRVVHKALALKLEYVLTPIFNLKNECSFAYQKGKNIKDAIIQMGVYFKQGYHIILEADIKKFFDTVNAGNLLAKIINTLPDQSIDNLLSQAVNQELGNIRELQNKNVFEQYFKNSEDGIPQGNALSPLLANIYLSNFDRVMINNGFKMIRYADDFIIMNKTHAEAETAFLIVKDELEGNLGLEIYPLKKVPSFEGEKISRIIDPRQTNLVFCQSGLMEIDFGFRIKNL